MPSNSPNFSFFIYDSTADEASLFKDYIDHMADNFGILDDIIVGEITDITLTTPANGELLILDTGVWINKTLAEAGISATGHTHTASNVTDFDTEVGNHTDVAANTTHRGITAGNPHGAEVEDLSDVTLASAGDKEMLTYNTSGGN
ncbi:MAG: hypothetical protein KQ78_01871 [Candidatus Izimaplasma bacterium HR2]|nr:MAG: hypothetical protein KQ78_01871 [Candidatus Izimaplasma bacterium HR2]